jgi:hypothetical protein
MSSGGFDTSMYAPVNRPSPIQRANDVAGLVNSVTQNQLLRTSIEKERLGIALEQVTNFKKQLASLASKKTVTRQDAENIINQQVELGLGSAREAAVLQNAIPEDENGIREWAKQHAFSLASAETQLGMLYKQIETDQGGNIERGTVDLFSGEVGPTFNTPKGFPTPADLTAPQTVIGPGGTQEVITKEELLRRQGNPLMVPGGTVPAVPGGTLPGNPLIEASEAAGAMETYPGTSAPIPEPADTIAPPPPEIGGGEVITEAPEGERGVQTGLAPGDAEAMQQSVATYTADARAAAQYNQRMFPLEKAAEILAKVGPEGSGPGAETVNDFKSFLITMGEELDRQTGMDLFDPAAIEQVKTFDELRKYLNDYAMRRAEGLGATNQQIAGVAGAQPNVHISEMANTEVVRGMIALERMQQAKMLDFKEALKSGEVTKQDYLDWSVDWNQEHDVRGFGVEMMEPKALKSLWSDMKPAERKRFMNSVGLAEDTGLVDPDRIDEVMGKI